jgi:outer membrane protein assembly factor BamB
VTILILALLAQDWPAWRHDAQRGAATPHALPAELRLQWTRRLPVLEPSWPDQPRARFDAGHEPVVAGGRVFVGSPKHDTVAAYDAATGAELWRHATGGPVRFAPFVAAGRVYAASDDGRLHCLDAEKGTLLWSHRGGPSDRLLLGNRRLISMWPARGAPVVADGVVYYAAGIWPFMGIFLHALDAESGRVIWTTDGDGPGWQKQPHNTEAFAGVAPQGCLVVAGERLIVPGGRSIPAVYDRRTGKLLHYKLAENARRGGFDVSASGSLFFCAEAAFDLESGVFLGELGRPLLAGPDLWHFAGRTSGLLQAPPQEARVTETKDSKGKISKRLGFAPYSRGSVEVEGDVEVLIRAGGVVYAGTPGKVQRVDAESGRALPAVEVEGTPFSLAAAADRLFVSTLEGALQCFGAEERTPVVHEAPPPAPAAPKGWALRFGAAPAEADGFDRVLVRPTPAQVADSRAAGAGPVLLGEPASILLPPYFASRIEWEEGKPDRASLRRLFDALHPYGGRLVLPPGSVTDDELREWMRELPGARVEGGVVHREGGVPGGGSWTHEHGDVANTRVSPDTAAKAPLGLLWFGGSSHAGILPRHGHGPQPLVMDGRLYIEGVNLIRAMDIYSGRILWETPLPGVGAFYNNTSHQPGANGAGSNLALAADGLHVAWGKKGVKLDPATGVIAKEYELPGKAEWGFIGVSGGLLIAGAEPLGADRALPKGDPKGGDDDPTAAAETLLAKIASFKIESDTRSSSRRLHVLDRATGEPRWTAEANHGWRHNAIVVGGGKLFAIDRLSGNQLEKLKRERKDAGARPSVSAFDLETGKRLWRDDLEVFGTWLSYSEEHDVLVEAGRVARDTIYDEAKGMRARRGRDGSELWYRREYSGPAMIRGREILMAGRGCELLTGKPKARLHPITEKVVEWTWTRTYGCNTPVCSEHLITFRSGAAGYFDLAADGGTGNWGGFRSSCTNNLVIAGGIVASPDYTRTCTCGYQQQTSLALVPMPDVEMWTFLGTSDLKGPVRRLGLNLGAPGDRRAEDGTYWIETPSFAGKSPEASVKVSGSKLEYFRRHSSRVEGPLPWVAASGVRGLSSLTLALDKDGKDERAFAVRLVFAEPDGLAPGGRVFDVKLQGREVLKDFDVAREAGGGWTSLVKEFKGVRAGKELKLEFKGAAPVLCGVEVVCEDPAPPEKDDEGALLRPSDLDEEGRRLEIAEYEWVHRPKFSAAPYYWTAAGASLLLVVLFAIRARSGGAA